jgi:hypothetical protein
MNKEEIVKRFYWVKGSGERTGRIRWTRTDGAVVKWDDSSPWPNSAVASARMWTAWEPDPSERALSMTRGRLRRAQDGHLWRPGFPRRWKTAEAAMAAVDREYPLQK